MQISTNFFCEYSFWLEVYKKCQKLCGHAVSQLFQFLTLNLYDIDPGLEAGSKESLYPT